MPIINRELDLSQRRTTYEFYSASAVATGVTGLVCIVPYPASIDGMQVFAAGVSGTPQFQLIVNRFTPGIGLSTFNIGSTFGVFAFGTSGMGASGTALQPLNASFPIQGSTTTMLQANDVIMFQTGGTNAAVTALGIELIIRPLNDITKFFGLV